MSRQADWEEAQMKKEKILKEQRQDAIEAEKTRMDKKAEHLVLERRMQMERVEREMEEQLEKGKSYALLSHEKHEKDNKLAAEMSRLLREECRERKLREQLRESSEELKTLESKLRAAYMRKQLTAQIAEKEARIIQEKLEKQKIQEMIEAEKRCMEEQAREKENALLAKKLKYKEDLQNQIKEGSKKVHDAQRDLMLEKALLEKSMNQLREEEEREKQSHLQKLKTVRQEIEEFQRQKENHKKSEKITREEEEKRIKSYEIEREKQEEKRISDMKEKEAVKNKIKDQIADSYLSKLQSNKEREEILEELGKEELRQWYLKRDKGNADAAKKLKEDFLNFYKKHVEEKEAAWRVDYQEQERYSHQLSDILAEQEKLDKSSAGNKAVKSKELQEVLQQQIKEKHKRRVEEWQRESALAKLIEVEEKERMRIVEEERMQMLKKHAVNLVGFLPRGVLRENDVDNLGPEFLEKILKHNSMNCS